MVETVTVEGVLEGEAALDLVGLDHGLEDILDLGDGKSLGLVGAREPVGDGEDASEVVGGMTPLGGEPAVVVVQPPDCGADVEGSADGVELVGSSGNFGAVGDDGTCGVMVSRPKRGVVGRGVGVPSTTGPRSFAHCSKFRASRPHPRVSMRHRRAVSHC